MRVLFLFVQFSKHVYNPCYRGFYSYLKKINFIYKHVHLCNYVNNPVNVKINQSGKYRPTTFKLN